MTTDYERMVADHPHRRGEHPLPGNVLMIAHDLKEDYIPDTEDETAKHRDTTDLSEANTVTSRAVNCDLHRPVLDLDLPAVLVPSSTPGHFHLYLDKYMTWETYTELLKALAAAGLIEEGYCNASIQRGYTRVRLPWVHKEPAPVLIDAPRFGG